MVTYNIFDAHYMNQALNLWYFGFSQRKLAFNPCITTTEKTGELETVWK